MGGGGRVSADHTVKQSEKLENICTLSEKQIKKTVRNEGTSCALYNKPTWDSLEETCNETGGIRQN